MPTQIFHRFFESANINGARSTALHSLQWGMGLILTGIPMAIFADSPEWLLILLAICLGTTFIVFIGSFIFLLAKDRDALRSEQFSLSKMAIEKGLVGDNITGLAEEDKHFKKLTEAREISDKGTSK